MHELGIANSILEGVASQMKSHPGRHARKVGVRIGELAGVDPGALQFAFEALTADTEMRGLELEIEYLTPRSRCRDCALEYEVRDFFVQCPGCGSANAQCISGDELDFAYLEVEENEPSAVGRKSSE